MHGVSGVAGHMSSNGLPLTKVQERQFFEGCDNPPQKKQQHCEAAFEPEL